MRLRAPRRAGAMGEWVALGAAIVPAVVMAARAATSGWAPLFDAAYFTVRSRDVLTEHNPFVGAWSMGSREVGEWVNNLGPLQLDLLAPFTKLDPYWGTAVGVAAINVAAIVGVWLVARRMFASNDGSVAVVGAMAATIVLELNEGSLMLIETRQQLALVLPLWCALWLAAGVWAGDRWLLPWLVFVASVVLQTHFTYAYQIVAVTIAAVIALAVRHRSCVARLARPALVTGGVAVVCWAQPLWDQVRGTGNLAAVLGQSGGSDRSVGAATGLRILAESAFVPPFFAPGSMGDLLRSGSRPSLATSVIALAAWASLLGVAAWKMWSRHRALAAMACIGLVALSASVLAVAKIPPTEQFGIIAQNYYWVWPIAVFCATALAGSALVGPVSRVRLASGPARADWGVAGLAVITALAAIPLLSPTNELPETDHEWTVSRRVARPLLDQLGDSLDRYEFDAPVLIDLGATRHVRYTLLAELQRRGIEFMFYPGSTDLSRFGRERCDDGSAGHLLSLRSGPGAVQLGSEATLLAAVPGLTDEQAARSAALAAMFGDAMRDGRVTVDVDGVVFLGGEVPPLLDQVLTSEGMPARGLSALLRDWRSFDAVAVPEDLTDKLDEWHALERAADDDRMAIYLQRIATGRPDRCAEVEPGMDFTG